MEGESSSEAPAEAIIKTLKTRGWCIEDDNNNQLKALITIQSALADDANDTSAIANSVEAEVLNMDIKSIGAKSLPDPNSLRNKASHYLQGPKILQISSVRDIAVSSIEGFSDSINRRLLRFTLTDGHNEIPAIEYSHIASIPNDVVPGTKVRLENKVPIQSGIICLNPNVITLLGGVVQSLYEEWQMTKKYSTLSRSLIRLSHETDGGGPPQFEKLQIRAPLHRSSQHSDYPASTSNSSVPTAANTRFIHDMQQRHNNNGDRTETESLKKRIGEGPRQNEDHCKSNSKSSMPSGSTEIRPIDKKQNAHVLGDKVTTASHDEQKPSTSGTRLKGVAESVPVQNQAAAQKLLQKMGNPNQPDRYSRGRKHKGKGKREGQQFITLEEWEKRNAGAKPLKRNDLPDASCDEDLARQLQNQLDMEDSHDHQAQTGTHNKVADDIRMSMFSYERDAVKFHGTERNGGGWGKGRGRGRGRGRGGGRHY